MHCRCRFLKDISFLFNLAGHNFYMHSIFWIFGYLELMVILGKWSNNTYLKLHQGYLKQLIIDFLETDFKGNIRCIAAAGSWRTFPSCYSECQSINQMHNRVQPITMHTCVTCTMSCLTCQSFICAQSACPQREHSVNFLLSGGSQVGQ